MKSKKAKKQQVITVSLPQRMTKEAAIEIADKIINKLKPKLKK
jgi:hypothetical protein